LNTDPLLNKLYNEFFKKEVLMTREQKYNEIIEEVNKECNKFTYPITNYKCDDLGDEINENFKKNFNAFIKFNYPRIKERMKNSEEPKIFTIKTKKTNPKEEEEKKTKQKNDEIFRLEAKLEELIKIYETAYLSDTMVYALTGRRRPKTVANPFDKNKAFSEYEKTLNELKLITDKKYKTLK